MVDNPFLEEAEIEALATEYGTPQRVHIPLEVGWFFWHPWQKKWNKRRGEVMFLLPRPGGLLLHRKSHYPTKGWRLLTGGIESNETVAEALEREPLEEVGLLLPVKRYVGIVSYEVQYRGRQYPFATHIFLLGYSDAPLHPSHDDEIAETQVVGLSDLEQVATTLETLPFHWKDWGRFAPLPTAKLQNGLRPKR